MSLGPETLEEVRRRVDIREIVGETVALRRQGNRLVGLCPFHPEKTPSFSIAPERGLFYCFGCQAGGDVFDFIMRRDSLTFPEVVRNLAERYGVPIHETKSPRDSLRDAGIRALEKACAFYEERLASDQGAPVRTYLEGRKISQETWTRFRLGMAPSAGHELVGHMKKDGVPDAILEATGLATKGRDGGLIDRFRGRLLFPIRDRQGRVIAFGGRLIDDRPGPKYLNSPDTLLFKKGNVLYDLFEARKPWNQTKKAVLVEGYMDVLSLQQAGVTGAVASLGTALTQDQVSLLSKAVEDVFVAYDGDRAGQGATMRGLWLLAASGLQTRFIRMPEGEDPDSLVRSGGAGAWGSLEDSAQRLVDYLTDESVKGMDVTTPQGKSRAARAVLPGILMLKSPVEQAEEMRRLSQRLGIDEMALRREARTGPQNDRTKPRIEERVPNTKSLRHTIELSIIKLLAGDPELVERLSFASLPWSLPDAQEVLRELAAGRDPAASSDEGARNLWARAQVEDLPQGRAEELIKALEREGKRERLTELKEDIRRLEASGDSVPAELLQDVQALSREFKGYE